MNVSKIEIAHALGILLSAVNDQPEKTEIEKKVADIEQLTGLNIDDVAGLYLLANKIAKDNEMGFDDIESTLLKVRTLALKHGDLDEVEDKLNFSHDAIVWWEEHGAVSDVRNLIEGKAEQNAIVEKYKAIMAIVNPAQVDEASGD